MNRKIARKRIRRAGAAALVCSLLALPLRAADWPTYRGDEERSGRSSEALALPLSEAWVFTALHPPSNAWGDPPPKPVEGQLEFPRVRFDDAFHAVVAGDLLCFGSSSEHKVVALDAATGERRWESFAEAPVRLAPAIHAGRVYFGADDGIVRCLDAASGRRVWSFAAAPAPRRVLGHGEMISLWPIRTGVLVADGTAYFGAGLFPAEGVYLFAVDAETGALIWRSDAFGQGGTGTISPQGYILASAGRLFVPSGRAMPAAFSRSDGRLLFHRNFNWRSIGLFGGTHNLLADDLLLTATEQVVGVSESSGQLVLTEGILAPSAAARRMAVDSESFYLLTGEELLAARRASWFSWRKLELAKAQRDDIAERFKQNPGLKA
ncbi:MAG: PQQ-like beta-propeller repeat protein, partial [Planctomycetes bacterium]|nr:PQQ-like beta-propeller repeat protein [Planctomycetota bacterium]